MADYTVYYGPTPNGKKITLAMEEMGLSYKIEQISMMKGEQFSDSFTKVSPNNKYPALVDHTAEGGDLAIFESGAILEYLADKTGKFLPPPSKVRERTAVKQWLYWQVAGFGPMLGQLAHFWVYAKEDVPYAKERYMKEALRLFGVLDKQLSKNNYIAGQEYSIADMATYWWSAHLMGVDEFKAHFQDFANVRRWKEDIDSREAVKKASAIPFDS